MNEEWRDISGFSEYQVSNKGQVRTFRNGREKIMPASDDGNGYLKTMLYGDDGKRHCKKVHRLVAETFIPMPDNNDDLTVDHIKSGREGKLDNSVENLRWISRSDNIKKAYSDGVCNDRIESQKKLVCCKNLWTNEECIVDSVADAAKYIGVSYTTISHAFTTGHIVGGHYEVSLVDDRFAFENGYGCPESPISSIVQIMKVFDGR